MKKPTADNPILNGPYQEPAYHYSTDAQGNLNYADVREGRRIFAPDTPQIPLNQSAQGSMFDLNDSAAEYREEIVNQVREQIAAWRREDYPGVTSRVTRDLLQFWFANPERQSWQNLFFAQREAIEAAIWLNEVAAKSNPGTHILNQLRLAQKTVGEQSEDHLPRIAFKMATGTGKTVVMACLILYHYLNRQEAHADTRFADYFLLVAPGITIRDRLSVLMWDNSTDHPQQARDYYRQRNLVPPLYLPLMPGLNARIVITNYHAFEPRLLSGNKKNPFDGKRLADGSKFEEREDITQTLKRVLGNFKTGRRLLVINDEAHHCYLPKAKGKDTDEEQSETENARAAVWFSGIREIAKRYRVGAVYDLSATPYYLSGSGYPPYSLFPWVVTDYGLIEAIEAGLVKIPFLPVEDSSQAIDEPVLRNIYEHCRDQLPKKGQRGQRKQDKADEKVNKAVSKLVELPPNLPQLVKVALEKFVAHYQRYDSGMRETGEKGRDLLSEPPVFIVVCNNTTVSKEVYKYIAGYEFEDENGEKVVRPGMFDIFSNYDRNTLAPHRKPPTLLIDSDALENSGQIGEDFKKVFAPEIEQFKRDYRTAHPEKSAEDLTDGDILREVVNTVGKSSALGSHVRCVVSVSMLTEGWDANTVTHIMGLRAFGSQLLCEQVAGRALRRRNYFIDAKTGKFPPEYAHIIGVPFKFFKGGETGPAEKVEIATLRALPERAELEIRFPQLTGYRLETPPGEVSADFSAVPDYEISLASLPVVTELGSVFTGERQKLELSDKLENLRDQEVVFWLTTKLIQTYYADHEGAPLARFAQLRAIADEWYRTKVKIIGETNPVYKRILRYAQDPKPLADAIQQGIMARAAATERILPIYNHYNRIGSTRNVFGHTVKPTYPTKKSHVNLVTADTESWEQIAAKTLEQLPAVESYVKNAFLGFNIPYVQEGKERQYMPDFIARIKTEDGTRFNLIIEITGFSKDKVQKRWYLEHRWLPAVNAAHDKLGMEAWHFIEVTDIERIKNDLSEKIRSVAQTVAANQKQQGMERVFHLLTDMPDDFYIEGREDPPPQDRDPLE